ncbi:MAG: hypothetical protein JRI45_11320 [Deltaproteobacteria bacterium]|nr:hypothetical protein [Deltaproteobacteria bacterium]
MHTNKQIKSKNQVTVNNPHQLKAQVTYPIARTKNNGNPLYLSSFAAPYPQCPDAKEEKETILPELLRKRETTIETELPLGDNAYGHHSEAILRFCSRAKNKKGENDSPRNKLAVKHKN